MLTSGWTYYRKLHMQFNLTRWLAWIMLRNVSICRSSCEYMLHFHGMHDDGLATRLAMYLLHCTSHQCSHAALSLVLTICCSAVRHGLPCSVSTIVRLAHTVYTVHNTCEECTHNMNRRGRSKVLLSHTSQCDRTWFCFKFFLTCAMNSSNKNLYRLLCAWEKGKKIGGGE